MKSLPIHLNKIVKVVFILIVIITILFILNHLTLNRSDSESTINKPLDYIVLGPNEPVRIGIIQDLSGGASVFGHVQLNTIKLALKERDYRILNREVEIQIEDEKCSSEGGKISAQKLVTDSSIIGIIGTTCSEAAAAASKVISEAGYVMISGINSASSLTSTYGKRGKDWNLGYFRTSSNDGFRGKTAAQFVYNKLGIKKVATIDDGDRYTKGAVDIFRVEYERLGGTIVVSRRVDKGDTDMKPVLTSIANSDAELLYFPLYFNEGYRILSQIRHMPSLSNIELLTGSTMLLDSSITSFKNSGVGVYFTDSVVPEGVHNQKLFNSYFDMYKTEPDRGYASAYDAINILLDAIEGVARTDNRGKTYIRRGEIRDYLFNIRGYSGATGTLSCSEYGDFGLTKFSIIELLEYNLENDDYITSTVYRYTPK